MVNDPDEVATQAVYVVREDHPRLRRERLTVRAMVAFNCRHHHGVSGICDACAELLAYSDRRLDLCPYGSDKPTCANCPIHCYRPEPRQRMREVMRFAGPRMLTRHPCLAIRHMVDGRRPAPPLPRRSGTHPPETGTSEVPPDRGRHPLKNLWAAILGTTPPSKLFHSPEGTRNGTAPPEE